METSELLKKVRKIEIKTKGLSRHIFSGEYHSAFKGRGMSFSEVRNYSYGDDVRNIDWNVTARYNEPFIKVFEEERELTVMLLVDVSRSSFFGTSHQFKSEFITEIGAVLAFSAISNNDKVGVIFFTDKIEKFIPPKKGRSHILRIIRELIDTEPTSNGTNIAHALQYLNNVVKKRCIAFLMTDFIAPNYEASLRIAARRHDLTGIHIYDQREQSLPNVGLLRAYDPEAHTERLIDTADPSVRKQYANWFANHQQQFKTTLQRCGVGTISIRTDHSYVNALIQFFKGRHA
jgi:uncharacterized protein (DUF58 family)